MKQTFELTLIIYLMLNKPTQNKLERHNTKLNSTCYQYSIPPNTNTVQTLENDNETYKIFLFFSLTHLKPKKKTKNKTKIISLTLSSLI